MKNISKISLIFVLLCSLRTAFAVHAKPNQQTFTENVGQVTDQHFNKRHEIDFKLNAANGLNVFIGSGKLHFQWIVSMDSVVNTVAYRMDVELLGANADAKVIKEDAAMQYDRFYTQGLNGALAHKYSRITYKDIYPNIDWVLYFTKDGALEYDFVVHLGGELNDIQIRYSGADNINLHADGSLSASTPLGSVKEHAPVAYMAHNKLPVNTSFKLKGDILSFTVADYTGTLVIDPVLEWGTYFGDIAEDAAWDIKTGKHDDIFAAGRTKSLSNIVTVGAHQTAFGELNSNTFFDAFLSRYDKEGNLLWSTYYGGEDDDRGLSVACDTAGNAYLSGYTRSFNNIASAGSYQNAKAGGLDAFIAKFDTSGIRIWASYYGGALTEGEQFMGLAIDRENNVYLSGNTTSTAGISTIGAFQPSYDAGGDAFLAKFSTSGDLLWATYLGGAGQDFACNMTTDKWNNVFVTGYTTSTNKIATSGTYQQALAGSADAFVLKMDKDGNRLWGTYFGGPTVDRGYSIIADDSGMLYMGGLTNSVSGIATPGSHQINAGGSQDGFLLRMDSAGSLEWATYVGGSANDHIFTNCLTFGVNGDLYLSGTTQSTSGIAAGGVLNSSLGGLTDGFVGRFTKNGSMVWGGYYGAAANDNITVVTADTKGNIYFGGYTNSPVNIATSGGFQNTFGGGTYDAFIVRLNDCEAPDMPTAIQGNLSFCSNDTALYSITPIAGADAYAWILPVGWLGMSDSTSIRITPNGGNSGDIKIAALNYCSSSDTFALPLNVLAAPQPVISRNANILSLTQLFSNYQWSKDGVAISGATAATYVVTANGSYTVTVTASNACSGASEPVLIENLSLSGTEARMFTIHPNPANDRLFVNIKVQAKLELIDVCGRSISSALLHTEENVLNIAHLPDGVYILRITGMDGTYLGSSRLVKASN